MRRMPPRFARRQIVKTPVRAASDFLRFMRGEMRRGEHHGSRDKRLFSFSRARYAEVQTPVRPAANGFTVLRGEKCLEVKTPVHLTVFGHATSRTTPVHRKVRTTPVRPVFGTKAILQRGASTAIIFGARLPTTTPILSAIVFGARLRHDNPGSFGDHFGKQDFSASTTPVCQAIAFS
jgi:hypothetical protein